MKALHLICGLNPETNGFGIDAYDRSPSWVRNDAEIYLSGFCLELQKDRAC